jgi:hypothetical protein
MGLRFCRRNLYRQRAPDLQRTLAVSPVGLVRGAQAVKAGIVLSVGSNDVDQSEVHFSEEDGASEALQEEELDSDASTLQGTTTRACSSVAKQIAFRRKSSTATKAQSYCA